MESLLGLPFWYGAIGLIVLTGVFTVLGGMKGVMTLSAIQTPILIAGSFLVLFLGLNVLGNGSIGEGWTAMMDYARTLNVGEDGVAYGTNHMFHFETGDPLYDDYPGFWVFIGAAIIGFWYWCTDQHIVQRVLGQQRGESNEVVMKRARRGSIAAGYFKLLPVFMFLIPGMVAAALAARPDSGFSLENPDTAFGAMVKFVLPAGVKGIVTIGFISALVASLAAFFNSCATLFTEDFYKPKFKNLSDLLNLNDYKLGFCDFIGPRPCRLQFFLYLLTFPSSIFTRYEPGNSLFTSSKIFESFSTSPDFSTT